LINRQPTGKAGFTVVTQLQNIKESIL